MTLANESDKAGEFPRPHTFERLQALLTGRLTPEVLDQFTTLLAASRLTSGEGKHVGALLAGAGAWIEGWDAEFRLQTSEPSGYG